MLTWNMINELADAIKLRFFFTTSAADGASKTSAGRSPPANTLTTSHNKRKLTFLGEKSPARTVTTVIEEEESEMGAPRSMQELLREQKGRLML